jgi:hypothetical protein
LVWTIGAGNLNWSAPLNWTNVTGGGYGPPGISNGVVFTNYSTTNASALTSPGSGVVVPAKINSSVNASFAVAGLTNVANGANTSPVWHNLGLAPGATLTANNIQVGGAGQYDFGANNVVNTTISGTGATLVVSNGAVIVSQGSGSSGAHDATLDLSGLDNFQMTGTQIKLGVENITRAGGILYLAKTNSLTLLNGGYINSDGSGSPYSGNPALYLGHNKTAVGNGAQMYLGISNNFAVDYVTIGRGDANGLLAFNPAFLANNPSVFIAGTNGPSSSVGVYVVGDNSPGEGASTSCTNDFSGGTVNALINYLAVGRGREGASDTTTSSGFLTFSNGTITANTLAIGFLYPNGSNSIANGTVNANGGLLTVNGNFTLATRPNTGGSGSVQGTLNLNGGTVVAANVTGSGGTANINLNSGTLNLQDGQITGISTLNVGANGNASPALLENAAAIAAANPIVIASNGIVAGNSLITSPGLTVNGTIAPGNGLAGTISASSNVTFGAGGDYVATIQDAIAGPGAGWSVLSVNNALNITATGANPFTIAVQAPAGLAQDFTYTTNYDWSIATAGGGISGFSPYNFKVSVSQFENDLAGGYFYVHSDGTSLYLSFTNNRPPVAGTSTLYRTGSTIAIPVSLLSATWSDPDGDPVILAGVSGSTNGAAVATDGNFIYYTNASMVADQVLYTVNDVRTNPPAVYQSGDIQLSAQGQIVLLPPPAISSITADGINVTLTGVGGKPNGPYFVLSSSDATVPLAQWTVVATNSFDPSGNFLFSTPVGGARKFYGLQAQ